MKAKKINRSTNTKETGTENDKLRTRQGGQELRTEQGLTD
jgi:hypothetical protein